MALAKKMPLVRSAPSTYVYLLTDAPLTVYVDQEHDPQEI